MRLRLRCALRSPRPLRPPASSFTVSSITDGDTLRFSPALEGTTILRMLHVDAPETAQAPWGEQSRAPSCFGSRRAATELRIETEQTRIDAFGRLLGHAIRRDGLDINREQLRLGQAVLYVIWPNVGRFEEYRAAEIEAQAEGRGIWNPAAPLTELPFEYRLRIDRDTPFRPVGDFFTRRYVEPSDYRRVRRQQPGLLQQLDGCRCRRVRALSADRRGDYSAELLRTGQIERQDRQVPRAKLQGTPNCQRPKPTPKLSDRQFAWKLAVGSALELGPSELGILTSQQENARTPRGIRAVE